MRRIVRLLRTAILAPVLAGALVAGPARPAAAADEPVLKDGQLIFPEGAEIPRYLTETERKWLESNPLVPGTRAVTSPPTGPVRCVAEYEPMEGVLIAWESFTTLLTQMVEQLTTVGNSDVYVVVDTSGERSTAFSALDASNADMSRVKFVIRTTDTVWIRDYGPRYIYEGQCRAIVDHTYNRPRPADDVFPVYFASFKNHAFYEHQLVHGGGNFHLNAFGASFVTRLINNENPGLTEQQIHDIWETYQNVDTTFFTPFPTSVDSTQHIDMWMQVYGDNAVMISDWPNNPGSTQDNICDSAAAAFTAAGWTVRRVPARSVGGVHYTYTNVVVCNDVVLVPSYTNTSVSPHNAPALAEWQAAMPDRTAVALNCQSIVTSAGVMHCVVMHVPVHLGGVNPTVYLRNLRGGEVLTPGSPVEIRWISDDDVGTSNVDIRLSRDGGLNFDTVIATMTADDGSHTWTVPDLFAPHARIRVIARDAAGNTGHDSSDSDLLIPGPPEPGDMNCDGLVNAADVPGFVLALTDPAGYAAAYPACDVGLADMNDDGVADADDSQGFVDAIAGP